MTQPTLRPGAGVPTMSAGFAGSAAPAAGRDLLDTDDARALFAMLDWGAHTRAYSYQRPLATRSAARVVIGDRERLMLSAYDYLGLIGHPAIDAAAIDAVRTYGTSSGGVRLLTGTTEAHGALDADIAAFKRVEASLSFSSGYLANLAAISALLRPGDNIIIDRLAHHSIVDACRLAGVRPRTFRHNDVAELDRKLAALPPGRRTLVVVEGVYSMDGDLCPLPDILAVKQRHGAFLMVDEAHSFGVLGANGRGVDEHYGVDPEAVDLWSASLSKAIPSNGGFIAGRRDLIVYLQHASGPFVFSSALCPSATAAARTALRIAAAAPERRERAMTNAAWLRAELAALGYRVGGESPIVPVYVGEDAEAHGLAQRLFELDVVVAPVVFPAVAKGAARLRLCATAGQTREDLALAVAAFRQASAR